MKKEYICPGCKEDGVHKCHTAQFGCNCPDCREYHSGNMEWLGRKCNCFDCSFERTIQKFQSIFTEEEQDDIYFFLYFRIIFREKNENSAKIKKIMEKRNENE